MRLECLGVYNFTGFTRTNLLVLSYIVVHILLFDVSYLPKVIKYVKRSKYSFHDFSAKHTPSATLIYYVNAITFIRILICFVNHLGVKKRCLPLSQFLDPG